MNVFILVASSVFIKHLHRSWSTVDDLTIFAKGGGVPLDTIAIDNLHYCLDTGIIRKRLMHPCGDAILLNGKDHPYHARLRKKIVKAWYILT